MPTNASPEVSAQGPLISMLRVLIGGVMVGVGLVGLGGFLVFRELARLTRRAWDGT